MSDPLLYSIIDTPTHPDLSALYRRLGYRELRLASQRKAIAELKREAPAVVVGEFVNAYHTYYQATNLSNLDVLLHSLVKYAPEAQVLVIAEKGELANAERLKAIHPRLEVVERPVDEGRLVEILRG